MPAYKYEKNIHLFLDQSVASAHSQLMVTKLVGKNSGNLALGFGLFAFLDFPIGNGENNSFRIELMDLAYYPQINSSINNPIGYISVKLGYKHVFSETQSGFYIEPQAGYCRVVVSNQPSSTERGYGDGIAVAFETGYGIGVGENGNAINIGIKQESDLAGPEYTANSIGFRISY